MAQPAGWGGASTLRRIFAVISLTAVIVAPAAAGISGPNPKQWGMPMIGAPTAWGVGTGAGVTIAVVDTGVDLGHPDLAGKIVGAANFVGQGSPQDDEGHGTHVAGIAAANNASGSGVVGVAPDASIMPIKVLDSQGGGATATIAQGIHWAADHGAQVINLSVGGGDLQPLTGASTDLTNACEDVWTNQKVICVIAAGNNGGLFGSLFGSGYPSNFHALVVTALGPDGRLAGYANSVSGAMWGLAAPGGAGTGDASDIWSTYWKASDPGHHGYAYLAGTSMAAPHVAGAVAILRGLGLSAQDAVDRLLRTAKNLGSSSYGSGRLDVAAAVAGLGAPQGGSSSPTTTATTAPSGGSTSPSTAAPTTTAAGSGSSGGSAGGSSGGGASAARPGTTAPARGGTSALAGNPTRAATPTSSATTKPLKSTTPSTATRKGQALGRPAQANAPGTVPILPDGGTTKDLPATPFAIGVLGLLAVGLSSVIVPLRQRRRLRQF